MPGWTAAECNGVAFCEGSRVVGRSRSLAKCYGIAFCTVLAFRLSSYTVSRREPERSCKMQGSRAPGKWISRGDHPPGARRGVAKCKCGKMQDLSRAVPYSGRARGSSIARGVLHSARVVQNARLWQNARVAGSRGQCRSPGARGSCNLQVSGKMQDSWPRERGQCRTPGARAGSAVLRASARVVQNAWVVQNARL